MACGNVTPFIKSRILSPVVKGGGYLLSSSLPPKALGIFYLFSIGGATIKVLLILFYSFDCG
jgi:hypothetical protein